MISNLLLLASAIYIYVDAIGCALKGFISSKILHLCFYSLGHQFAVTGAWTKLHLLSQPSRYEVFLARWVQEVDLQVLLHSPLLNNTNLSLLIVSACDILVQTQGLCGHPTKTCLSGNVKWTRKCIIFCCTFICIGIYWFEEMVTSCSWYSLTQGKSFFSTQVKLLSFFQLKYNKTVCRGCLSYKKPA